MFARPWGGCCWSFPRGWEEGGVLSPETRGSFPWDPANSAACTPGHPAPSQEKIRAPWDRALHPVVPTPTPHSGSFSSSLLPMGHVWRWKQDEGVGDTGFLTESAGLGVRGLVLVLCLVSWLCDPDKPLSLSDSNK